MGWARQISDISNRSKMNISGTLANPGYSNTGIASTKSASDTCVCFTVVFFSYKKCWD